MSNLTTFLAETGTSQAKLSETLGISRAHMSLLVSGERKPSLDLAFAIARVTGGAVPVSSWESDPPAVDQTPTSEDAA